MGKTKKLEIDISTDELKNKVFNLFCEFDKICEIYAFFGVEDTPYNNRYVHKIADEIGFDFSTYKEKRKRFCAECGKELKHGQKKFCSSSCSAKHNNKGRHHSKETRDKIAKSLLKTGEFVPYEEKFCPVCGKKVENKQRTFCSNECFQKHIYEQRVSEWQNTPEKFSKEDIPAVIRRYLFEKYDCKCQKCGWGEMNETTGKIPLEVHHINGDCTDNREENLQLLCPNCHSLTPNHGSLNRNSKRYKLKKYKDLIKS